MTTTSTTARRLAIALGNTVAEAEIQTILDFFTNGTLTLPGTLVESVSDNLVALAGGAQAGTPLPSAINRVITVASAGDSVQLPTSVPGLSITVINAAATNSMNVFPQTGDATNALAANVAFAVAAGKTVSFFCTSAGRWHTQLSA